MHFDSLVRSEQVNATLGWLFTAATAAGAVVNVVAGSLLWALLLSVVILVVALPALVSRTWSRIVPWPLVAVVALSVFARLSGLYLELTGYIVVVILSLIIVTELEAFSSVELTRRFAAAFGVMTAMAAESLWIIAQYVSDVWLDTRFLRSQTELQWDIVATTAVAITVGILYHVYATSLEPAGAVSVAGEQQTQ
jgi:hypothetical protein